MRGGPRGKRKLTGKEVKGPCVTVLTLFDNLCINRRRDKAKENLKSKDAEIEDLKVKFAFHIIQLQIYPLRGILLI